MKPRFPWMLTVAVLALPAAGRSAPQERVAHDLTGSWLGTLKVGALELRLVLHVERTSAGNLRATFDSLDQGAMGLEVHRLTLDKKVVSFEMKRPRASFRGDISDDGREIVGTFTQRGRLPLTWKRQRTRPTLLRPQVPDRPYPYHEEEIFYSHDPKGDPATTLRIADEDTIEEGRVRLAATLTLPKSSRPHPTVVLISGSGPQDRDEALMGHRPFLVLADSLTRRGLAVLRFDDRGVGESTGSFKDATSEDFAKDVLAGVHYLRTRHDIAHERIGLIGHSEGGLIAPMIAADSDLVAFIILLAAPAVRGDEILEVQSRRISEVMGLDEERIQRTIRTNRTIFRVLQAEGEDARDKVQEIFARTWNAMPEGQRKRVGGDKDFFVRSQTAKVATPWFRFFVRYDPRENLRRVRCPVLALTGELDLQVDPGQNLPVLAKCLEQNSDFTIVKLAGLNHLFQTCKTGAPNEYGAIEETFAPLALRTIGEWIAARFF